MPKSVSITIGWTILTGALGGKLNVGGFLRASELTNALILSTKSVALSVHVPSHDRAEGCKLHNSYVP